MKPLPSVRIQLRRKSVPFQFVALGLSTALLIAAGGCARVPVHQQRLVSKPNMLFSDSPVFSYYSKILPQAESGAAASGGASAAGCTSCR